MTYSSSIAAGRQKSMGRNQNVTPFRTTGRSIGPVSNTIIIVVLVCLLGLLYLSQVTKTNAYGFERDRLQESQAELRAEFSELELNAARLQSVERVQNSAVAKGLVPASPAGIIQN